MSVCITVSTVDYMLVTPRLFDGVTDFVVDQNWEMPSDHYLVLSKLSVLVPREADCAVTPVKVPRGRWCVPRLCTAADHEQAAHSCDALTEWRPNGDASCEQAANDFMESCTRCFSSFAHWRSADDQRAPLPRWLDFQLRQMVSYRRLCYARWRGLIATGGSQHLVEIQWREYVSVRTLTVATTWTKKHSAWIELMKSLNSYRFMDTRSLYQTIN